MTDLDIVAALVVACYLFGALAAGAVIYYVARWVRRRLA